MTGTSQGSHRSPQLTKVTSASDLSPHLLLVSAADPGLHAAAASPQLQAQGPRHHHWPGGRPLEDPRPGEHRRLLASLSRGDFLHPRSASECLMSQSQHVWFSLRVWDDGAPGVHGHLVSTL